MNIYRGRGMRWGRYIGGEGEIGGERDCKVWWERGEYIVEEA